MIGLVLHKGVPRTVLVQEFLYSTGMSEITCNEKNNIGDQGPLLVYAR